MAAVCLAGDRLAAARRPFPAVCHSFAQSTKESPVQSASPPAGESLEALLAEPHPDSDALLRTGIALAQRGRFSDAARAFTRCVRDYPDLFEGHYNLALAELAQNHLTQAYAAIDQAPHPTDQEAIPRTYLKGKIEAAMGRTQQAEQDLSAAFEKAPEQENFALDLGLVLLQAHAYQQAMKVFTQASDLNPRSTYLLLGRALAEFLGERTAQCIETSRRLLAADPDFSPARLLLAFTYYFDGNFAGAGELARAGLKLPDPDPYLYYLEAVTLFKQHGPQRAQILDDLSMAEKSIPKCALCYVASGKVHEEQNNTRGALADFQTAVGLAPDLSEGWFHLAKAYDRLGDSSQAAKARKHFQAMKANEDEREKEMMRGVLLQSLGASSGPAAP